jgi:small ligand-binding sensory domain FIST
MKFAVGVSEATTSDDAVAQCIDATRSAGVEADLAFVFFTAHHADEAASVIEKLWLELDPQVLIGCSAEGVVGGDREIEREAGLVTLVGQLPNVTLHPFHIGANDWHDLLVDEDELKQRMGVGEMTRTIIGFGDPFTTPTNQFLAALDAAAGGSPLIGGMASAARQPGENILIRNDETIDDGFVGVSLSGAIDVQTIVSQGCRPIGKPLVITKGRENIIEQLGGKPALDQVRDLVESLPPGERELLSHGLLIGRAISEYRDNFGRGDFLVRNLMGVDQSSKAIAVTDRIRVGQTVQFHVRDAVTADEDLTLMLETQNYGPSAAAALLFSCNGRGTRMFSQMSHDITVARAAMPQTPVAGFFAAGELGPVGGKNFIHGHTASMALLRPKVSE